MKTIVKKIFNNLDYEIIRAPKPTKHKGGSRVQHDIEFIQDEKFGVEFTRLTLDENQYFVPKYASHRPAVQNLLNGTLYEPDTHDFVRGFCKSFKGSMVHAGTFFGDMIPNFSRSVSGNVYAFEPVFENYILAKLCVDNNRLENVILMNSALSDGLGNLNINTSESGGKHAGGASTISDKGAICTAINIDRLNIEDLVLIQLDVEGHELIALIGAKETIQRSRPVIAIEDNDDNCTEFLRSINYENAGHIPGLTIWAPSENNGYKIKIESLIS
ncbi:FkbM family methyltransferase [Flexistipes sinusarabici]|nr:FkbM family methyltransferase [Flexistipes sinusarabici]